MTHTSPSVYLTWAVLSTTFEAFLIFHLWSFDRFKCLRWNNGPYSGAFKRVMTYSYLLCVPLIMIYSIGFAAIKYAYGYTSIAFVGIVPTPYYMWGQLAQNAIFPLYLCLAFAWGCEMVTHLEELCFWLFVIHSNSPQQDWFRSLYFKIWTVGSFIAVVTMPLVTILTRNDVFKCEAFTFLIGGLGSFLLTVWFLPVLWAFPSFLANLKQHDVETHTLIRLTKFHELNCIRVVCRFLFTVPLIILGADGVRPYHDINKKMFPTDLLAILAGIGCLISSGLTLIIFFPRSTETEVALREQQRMRRKRRLREMETDSSTKLQTQSSTLTQPLRSMYALHENRSYVSTTQSKSMDKMPDPDDDGDGDKDREAYQVKAQEMGLPDYDVAMTGGDALPCKIALEDTLPRSVAWSIPATGGIGTEPGTGWTSTGSIALQPNRRNRTGDVELGGVLSVSEVELLRERSKRDNRTSVHNLVHHWRSPLEIGRPLASTWRRRF